MENGIIWIDIETTGTNYNTDKILQIAVIRTDNDFNILEEKEWIVKHDIETVKGMSNDFVKEMHNKTGLWDRIETEGISLEQIDKELEQIIRKVYGGKWQISIGGNSVHFDMNFIKNNMELSGALISHRVLDISAVLQFMRLTGNKVELPKHIVSHDALDDIRWSLIQAKAAKRYL